MPDANKLVIELVDAGGEGGKPPTSPGSSTDRAEGASGPVESIKLDELLNATRELLSKIKPAADDWKGVTPELERYRKAEVDPEGAARYAKLWQDKQAKEGVVTAQRLPGTGPQAGPTLDDLSAGQPAAKSASYGKADVAVIEMNLLAADYAKRVAAKLLTYDEALSELSKAAKARGVGLTEALRGAGKIGLESKAADYYAGQFRDQVRDAGLPVPATATEPLKASDLRPVAMPKPNRPVAQVVETKEQRESREKDEEKRRNNLLLAGIATQNLAGGGIGQKAAGAVQLAGTGMLGQGAAKAAGGNVGAAVQLAGVITDLVDGAIRSIGQGARSGVRTAGDIGTSVARNDGLAAFTKGVDGAADVLAKVPIAGTAAAESLRTFTTVLSTAREVIGAFADRGRELRMYSGPIAQAAAQADVKKLLLDMAEANRFSAQYVKMIEAESRVNAAWRRASDPIRVRIMEFLASKVAPWMERIGERVEKVANAMEIVGVMVDNVEKLAKLDFEGFAGDIKKKMKDIDDELKKRNQPVEAGMQAVESWYTALDKLQLPAARPDPGRDRQLKLPVLLRMGG